jgi:hypothetical protein
MARQSLCFPTSGVKAVRRAHTYLAWALAAILVLNAAGSAVLPARAGGQSVPGDASSLVLFQDQAGMAYFLPDSEWKALWSELYVQSELSRAEGSLWGMVGGFGGGLLGAATVLICSVPCALGFMLLGAALGAAAGATASGSGMAEELDDVRLTLGLSASFAGQNETPLLVALLEFCYASCSQPGERLYGLGVTYAGVSLVEYVSRKTYLYLQGYFESKPELMRVQIGGAE